jgi:hypothetical protein
MHRLSRSNQFFEMYIAWGRYQDSECFESVTYKGLKGRKGYKKLLKDIAHVDPLCGTRITDAIKEMLLDRDLFGIRTYMYFNDVYLVCEFGDTAESLKEQFHQICQENSERYRRTFRYKLREREMEEREKDAARRKKIVESWMEEKMKIKFFKILKFRKLKKVNESNSYSKHVMTYAQEWAVGMQRAMRKGKEIPEVANEMSHFVDYDGISGFMNARAASVIATFWKHGEEFRQWYNLYHQIGDEGERANKKKRRILNPVVLCIGGD